MSSTQARVGFAIGVGMLALLAVGGCDLAPGFSSDGRFVLFQSMIAKERGVLVKLELESGEMTTLVADHAQDGYAGFRAAFAKGDAEVFALAVKGGDDSKTHALRLTAQGERLASVELEEEAGFAILPVAAVGDFLLCVGKAEGDGAEESAEGRRERAKNEIGVTVVDMVKGKVVLQESAPRAASIAGNREGLFYSRKRVTELEAVAVAVGRYRIGDAGALIEEPLFEITGEGWPNVPDWLCAGQRHLAFGAHTKSWQRNADRDSAEPRHFARITDFEGRTIVDLTHAGPKPDMGGSAFGHDDRSYWIANGDSLLRYSLPDGSLTVLSLAKLGVPDKGEPIVMGITASPVAPLVAIQLMPKEEEDPEIAYDLLVLDESKDDVEVVARVRAPR
jgi:hypothetical protein